LQEEIDGGGLSSVFRAERDTREGEEQLAERSSSMSTGWRRRAAQRCPFIGRRRELGR
jgi:hypothetical protein